ncbi:unnamed protein product [Paramecium pentaurelia]|uniref:Uncharacterized protein n=1 Tax=Paramecium pentaurelia TaxID=43138 RepID=A0A8S1V8E4_9CILI|nr:unnamed protein product [Paramecium pentaurelia]
MTNQLGVGFGAYKFQTIINSEMRVTKDSVHRTRIQTESRKSIQDKCKYQFQNAKKKIIQKLQDPNERERFNTLIQVDKDSDDSLSGDPENQAAYLLQQKKKKEKEFELYVSESSSFSGIDSDDSLNEPNQEVIKKSQIYEEENKLASQNLKALNTPTILKSPQISSSRAQVALQKVKAMKNTRYPVVKKDIDFLRSLCQNQNFFNNEKAILEEYKLDKEICVDMDCQDIVTFMRLQHEVEEMRRKQTEFNTQKERHYEVTKNLPKKSINKSNTKAEDNGFCTVMMAKRFIKTLKLKVEQKQPKPPIQAINLLRKSTRGSTLKTQF